MMQRFYGPNPEFYLNTAQGLWWAKQWGVPNAGSICPSTRERSRQIPLPDPFGFYPGSVNSAWAVDKLDAPYSSWFGSDPQHPYLVKYRVGSYVPNNWLAGGWSRRMLSNLENSLRKEYFLHDGDVQNTSQTPAFADGTWWEGFVAGWWRGPRATDFPARNLVAGYLPGEPYGMPAFTIPRHGSRPSRVSTNHPPNLKLPGSIHVTFYDSHAEAVKLEDLWQLTWHRNYVPPVRRPGL